jgi:hypothetical protein
MMGLDFVGRVFEDNFLIADVEMKDATFPVERRFWFDPPFNRGQSALLHKQPDDVWRIDLQLGWAIDKERESRIENVRPRLKAFLGPEANFELEWVLLVEQKVARLTAATHREATLFQGRNPRLGETQYRAKARPYSRAGTCIIRPRRRRSSGTPFRRSRSILFNAAHAEVSPCGANLQN